MICLHCGYCCFMYDVVIISNDLGTRKSITDESNYEIKSCNQRCKHLKGNSPGNFTCAMHDKPWYKNTPCFRHGQYEQRNSKCRLGEFILSDKENQQWFKE